MRKFQTIVVHEYRKVVLKWTFLIGTLLFPVIAACFVIVPAIIFSLKGEPTRIVVVDTSSQIAPRLKEYLASAARAATVKQPVKDSMNEFSMPKSEVLQIDADQTADGFVFVEHETRGRSRNQVFAELTEKTVTKEIDAFLFIPDNIHAPDAEFEFVSRKVGNLVGDKLIKDALNEAVLLQRLSDAKISEIDVRQLKAKVRLVSKTIDEKGRNKDTRFLFSAAFAIGLMMYVILLIYGQVILGAVVEEKETRISEILFSSATPFELLFGKLVGVGLAGLSQLSIWVASCLASIVFLATKSNEFNVLTSLDITGSTILYFFTFFIVGYFVYASIFTLIGAMVTTVQEGGQFAFPPIMIMALGFYFSFAVLRDPDSTMSFWVSISPFLAPLTMPVRILAETPPFWQIGLAVVLNCLTIAGLVWIASRVYRIGMLMYGKRVTVPEAWKWIWRD